ncbi:MAG: SHOCT domain-containing protein [Pseudonocardiaceae bacterium]
MDAMMDGMGGGMMVWMLLWGLLGISLLVLAVVGAVALARKRSNDQAPAPRRTDEAVAELRRRLAAGEIDEDEYLRRRSALE